MAPETPAEAYRRLHSKNSAPSQKSPRRVHSLLRAAIYSGEIAADERLLEEDLVKEHSTSRNAVREALALLAEEGLVTRVTGVGTVVVGNIVTLSIEGFTAPTDADSGGSSYIELDSAVVPSTKLLRTKLATEASEVRMNEFVIRHGNIPFCLSTSYTRLDGPAMAFRGFNADWTLADAFESAYGVPLAHVETHLSAVLCEPRTARKLGVPEGSSTLLRARLVTDETGHFREYNYAYFVERNVVMHASTSLVDGMWRQSDPLDFATETPTFGV